MSKVSISSLKSKFEANDIPKEQDYVDLFDSLLHLDSNISITKMPVMGAATASIAGTIGSVPASSAGDQAKVLRADATWVSAGAGDMVASTYDAAEIEEQLVGLTATQTLTNKTLTSPTIAGTVACTSTPDIGTIAAGLGSIFFGADGVSIAQSLGMLVFRSGAATQTDGVILDLGTMTTTLRNTTDGTPTAGMLLYNSTTGTLQYYNGSAYIDVVALDKAQTVSSKTLTAPTFTGAVTNGSGSYYSGIVRVGGTSSSYPGISNSGAVLQVKDATNSALAKLDVDNLALGVRSSSGTLLKRDGTSVKVRLGDDSADGGLTCSTLTTSGACTLDSATVYNNLTVTGLFATNVQAGVTASTNQAQGQGAITKNVVQISTCATTNDAVTLPTAVAGISVVIKNNGAETLRVWPATGDNLGAGVNTATTITAAALKRFTAYDATTWIAE